MRDLFVGKNGVMGFYIMNYLEAAMTVSALNKSVRGHVDTYCTSPVKYLLFDNLSTQSAPQTSTTGIHVGLRRRVGVEAASSDYFTCKPYDFVPTHTLLYIRPEMSVSRSPQVAFCRVVVHSPVGNFVGLKAGMDDHFWPVTVG